MQNHETRKVWRTPRRLGAANHVRPVLEGVVIRRVPADKKLRAVVVVGGRARRRDIAGPHLGDERAVQPHRDVPEEGAAIAGVQQVSKSK